MSLSLGKKESKGKPVRCFLRQEVGRIRSSSLFRREKQR